LISSAESGEKPEPVPAGCWLGTNQAGGCSGKLNKEAAALKQVVSENFS